jgi:opacity protein-like surface antigen
MFRKKLLLASLVSASMIPAIAQADTKNFEGLSVYGSLNHITSSVKLSDSPDSIDGLGKSDLGFNIGADYGFAFGGNGVLLIGTTYSFGSPKVLDFNAGGEAFSFKEKSGYSVYVAPGVIVGKETLLYFKLSHNNTKIEASGDIIGDKSFSGVGYGVGSRMNINKSTFINVEFQQLKYGAEEALGANWKPSATVGSVAIGLRF